MDTPGVMDTFQSPGLAMKRSFDFAVALLGLTILMPVFIVVGILTKLSSPGPVLYGQTRVGRNGEEFQLYKFRSMIVDADKQGSSVTTSGDPRITKIGRYLRRTKLDELPQLWNVLVGDMSLVGPRPDVPQIVATYTPEMLRILDVRPGITSIASLHLRDEERLLLRFQDPDEAYTSIVVPFKVTLAMEHVRRDSFWFDLLILLQTIWAITLGRILPLPEHPGVRELKKSANL